MICPFCHYSDTKVVDSRVGAEGFLIKRRRQCLKCNFRFSTQEEMEILDLKVMKKSGKTENYQREKLESGVKKALEKRPFSTEQERKLVYHVERDIAVASKNNLIESKMIGEIVMEHLKNIDLIAYLRFASVYQSFETIENFKKELDKLLKKQK